MWCVDMRVLYRLNGCLSLSCFSEAEYDDETQTLELCSPDLELSFKIPRTSALLALTKLLADGYCDLQAFSCNYF